MTRQRLTSRFPKRLLRPAPVAKQPSTVELERYAQDYLRDCDYRMQSPRTIETRRISSRTCCGF
jgi:hypothetical protein